MTTSRGKLIDEAKHLIHSDRNQTYGEPADNMKRIADFWTLYLGTEIRPDQVPVMMTLTKIARLMNELHPDGFVDSIGYMAIAGELSEKLNS